MTLRDAISLSKRPKAVRAAFWILVPLLALLAGCRWITNHRVTIEDRDAARGADGVRIGYEERDLGPPDAAAAVLFVHGFVGATSNFADVPERLAAKGWRVRVMRLPGHGTSPRDYEKTTPEELTAAVREELAALRKRHKRVGVVSHSMGGTLSTLAVASEGGDALVLGAPYFGVTYRWYYILPVETWTRMLGPLVRWVYKGKLFIQVRCKEAKKDIDSYTWIPTRGAATLAELGRRANDPYVLSHVTCPVLMLHADGDHAASAERSKQALDRMASREKRFVPLPNSDHHIYWDCERELVATEIEKFLGEKLGE